MANGFAAQAPNEEEESFQKWYRNWATMTGINPDPDDPLHKYDYRAAYKAGAAPKFSLEDNRYHWPSEFKADDHPNRFVNGVDTKQTSGTDEFGGTIESAPAQRFDEFGGTIENPPTDLSLEQGHIPTTGEKIMNRFVRPGLQAVGTAVGVLTGAGAGATTGPAAPVMIPIAMVAGGGIGFAWGDEVADLFEQFLGMRKQKPLYLELKESAEDIRTGLTYEMGGHVIGPAGKAIMATRAGPTLSKTGQALKRFFTQMPMSTKGAERKAGEVLAAMVGDSPMIVKNVEEARALEELIPGLKFNLAQLTDDPNVINFVRSSRVTDIDFATQQAEQALENVRAITKFIEKTKGEYDIEDVFKRLGEHRTATDLGVEATGKGLVKETDALEAGMGPMDIGGTISKELRAGEQAARKEAGKKFKEVTDQVQIVDDLLDEFKKIMKPIHPDEGAKRFPSILQRTIDRLEGGGVAKAKAKPTGLPIKPGVPGEYPHPKTPASIKDPKTGKVFSGRYHEEAVDKAVEAGFNRNKVSDWEEGFMSSKGKWLTRDEAQIAYGVDESFDMASKMGVEAPDIAGVPKPKVTTELLEPKLVTDEPTMTLEHIQGLRSEILDELRMAVDRKASGQLRKRLFDAAEVIDKKLSGQTKATRAPSEQLKKAQQFFKKEVIDKYHVGASKDILGESVQDAAVAMKYFKIGPKGEQSASEFMTALGDNPAAQLAMKEHVGQSLLDSPAISPKTGEISMAGLNKWRNSYKYALKKLGLEKEFDSLAKARKMADTALVKSREFEKSAASIMLDADVNVAVQKAFAKGSKGKAAKELMEILKGDVPPMYGNVKSKAVKNTKTGEIFESKMDHATAYEKLRKAERAERGERSRTGESIASDADIIEGFIDTKGKFIQLGDIITANKKIQDRAIRGLQNAFVDNMLAKIPLEGSGEPMKLLSSKQAAVNLEKYDAALKVIFKDSPKKLEAMRLVRKAVEFMERGTPEGKKAGLKRVDSLVTFMAKKYGFRKLAIANIVKATMSRFKGLSNTQINAIVNRALLDPDLAYGFMQAARGGRSEKATRLLIQNLVRLGLVAPRKGEEKK